MPLSTNVPFRFLDTYLEDFDNTRSESSGRAYDAAEKFLKGEYKNLVLVGPTGAGKTHIAAAITNAIIEMDADRYAAAVALMGEGDRHPQTPRRPMWVNVADLMVQMRSEMSRPDDDRPAARIAIHLRDHPKLVVLDDLGREKASDWTGEVIYSLVNHRYEERLETIVTSNLTAAELGAGPYWPVISRLAEDGRLIDMAGTPDKRLTR